MAAIPPPPPPPPPPPASAFHAPAPTFPGRSASTPPTTESTRLAPAARPLPFVALVVLIVGIVVAVRDGAFASFGLIMLSGPIGLVLFPVTAATSFAANVASMCVSVVAIVLLFRLAMACTPRQPLARSAWRASLDGTAYTSLAFGLLVVPFIGALACGAACGVRMFLFLRRSSRSAGLLAGVCAVLCGTCVALSQHALASRMLATAHRQQLPELFRSVPEGDPRVFHAMFIASACRAFANANGGAYPEHPVQLLVSPCFLGYGVYRDLNGDDPQPYVGRAGEWSVGAICRLPAAQRPAMIGSIVADLPDDEQTSIIGQFVLVRGLRTTSARELWLVVLFGPSGMPEGQPPAEAVVIVTADGGCDTIPPSGFRDALERQDELRMENGLPPLRLQSLR